MGFIQDKTAGLVTTRTAVLVVLLLAPIAVYSVVGSIAVWQLGWMRWLWWLAPIVWALAWVISRLWPPAAPLAQDLPQPQYWTPRDDEAANIIQRFQEDVERHDTDQLTDPQFYLNQAQSLANELARHYRPGTVDPISERTLPEILAACRLVADDLEQLLLTSVPGSRILTVSQWRKLSETPKFVRQASKAFWATKILLNPFNLAQWGTSKVTNDKVTTDLQTELLSALYVKFVKQLGYYLIEMNSGRLRAGADSYRAAFGRVKRPDGVKLQTAADQTSTALSTSLKSARQELSPAAPARDGSGSSPESMPADSENHPVKVAFMGEAGIGKSALIRALLNEPAEVDDARNLPPGLAPTRSVEVFEFSDPVSGLEIQLLDTPGYPSRASGKTLVKSIRFAVENSHAIFLVLDASAENWTADLELLEGIEESFRTRENLRPPKVIAVFSITDRSDSGNLNQPHESSAPSAASLAMDSVIKRAQSQFKHLIDDFVPHPLSRSGDKSQFKAAFWEVMGRHLDAARFNAVLAAFEASLSKGKYRILFSQAKTSGRKLISSWLRKDPS